MSSKIKVVKMSTKGLLFVDVDEEKIAASIEKVEREGWRLISSFATSESAMQGRTDHIVFIYRKAE